MAESSAGSAAKPSFLSTTTGLLTAFGGVLAAITALVTALYSAGLIGHKQQPAPPAAAQTQPAQTQPNRAARRPPPQGSTPAPAAQSSPAEVQDGQYTLRTVLEDGQLQPAEGTMKLTRNSDQAFDFVQMIRRGNQTHRFAGKLIFAEGSWQKQVENNAAIPVDLTERNGLLTIGSGNGRQMQWQKQ